MNLQLLFVAILVILALLSPPLAGAFLPATASSLVEIRAGVKTSSIHGQASRISAAAALDGSDENASSSSSAVAKSKRQIERAIANTDKGRSSVVTHAQRSQILSELSNLESLCPLSEPARDRRMDGPWIVLYTDAPPPSNGQLGPLKGVAKQVIDLKRGTYKNELYIGGSGSEGDENAWITAVLEATWKEWDGVYLDHDDDLKSSKSSSPVLSTNLEQQQQETSRVTLEEDYGATTWRVDFISLTLSVMQIPIFKRSFKAGTARTWKMTYLDDDTRIVRAGKTGRDEDDWIFYMRRGEVKKRVVSAKFG